MSMSVREVREALARLDEWATTNIERIEIHLSVANDIEFYGAIDEDKLAKMSRELDDAESQTRDAESELADMEEDNMKLEAKLDRYAEALKQANLPLPK